MSERSALGEIVGFIRARRRFWLVPLFIVLALLCLLIVLAESSAVAPFIYTLF